MIYSFGSGVLLGVRTDIANATPLNFGMLQEVTLDLQYTTKELYGQYQFPLAIARGQGKCTGKAKLAQISGLAFGNFFFGQTPVAGQLATSYGEVHSIPATPGPYTATVTNSATFVDDLGVVYSATGLPLTKVASGPTVGEYSVAAGVYTFAAADQGLGVLINYTYTVAATGEQMTITNQLLGTTPTFQAQLFTTFQGKSVSVKLFECVSSKLSFATKLDDFTVPELDFSIQANAAGNVLEWSQSEAS